MSFCEHYFACSEHRGRNCEACGRPLLYVSYEAAPTVARCHVLPAGGRTA